MEEDNIVRVSGKSNSKSTASAISHAIEESRHNGSRVVVRAIGAGAINQSVKALTIARGFLSTSRGIDLAVQMSFFTVEIPSTGLGDEPKERTAINFHLIDLSRYRGM